jgi:hypothetical protein
MLDLQARVHLEEIELAAVVQELDRAGPAYSTARAAATAAAPMAARVHGQPGAGLLR